MRGSNWRYASSYYASHWLVPGFRLKLWTDTALDAWRRRDKMVYLHSVKKIPKIVHLNNFYFFKKNLFWYKLVPMYVIVRQNFHAICRPVYLQLLLKLVDLKCALRFLQLMKISNKEFASNFVLPTKRLVLNRWRCCSRLAVSQLHRKHERASGTKHSKAEK